MQHLSSDETIIVSALISDIKAGNRRALSKAISLSESMLDEDRILAEHMLTELLPLTGNAKRIGITGSPGVGKSTFIEAFGLACIERGEKVAVLAIDPSSQSHGGSILGDKVRMPILARSDNAFIRPTPSKRMLGGISHATREAMLLCEAAGYSTLLIETVGVGQSEVEVRSITDMFLLLMLPNAGDEIQGIKRGIMELADIIFVNKADGEFASLAEVAKSQIQSALTLMQSPTAKWNVRTIIGSGIEGKGILELLDIISVFFDPSANHHYALKERRIDQAKEWFELLFQRELIHWANKQDHLQMAKQKAIADIEHGKALPSSAVHSIIDTLRVSK